MKRFFLLAVSTVMTHCEITNNGTKIKDFHGGQREEVENRFGVLIPQRNFNGLSETFTKELRSSKEQRKVINHRLHDTAEGSKHDFPNFNISIHEMNFERGTGPFLFQSDVVQANRESDQILRNGVNGVREKRQIIRDFDNISRTWQNGVFYTFDISDHYVQKIFKMGVKVWTDYTCIDFFEDRNAQDKIVVVKGAGCYSASGRLGGDQFLSLGEGCEAEGIAVHEIGHALGLLHTMNRFDRDNYIIIVYENVNPTCFRDFAKVDQIYADVYNLTYDYGSVMHYDEKSFTFNCQTTMIATQPLHQRTMGSHIISFTDIYVVNERYGCNERCNKSTSAKCANEGFPHPRNCSLCICPGGYGGVLCDRRPSGCGENIFTSRRKRKLRNMLGNGTDLRDQFSFCNYMLRNFVEAPKGRKIEVEVLSVLPNYDDPGCIIGGVEIKAQEDQKLTGYRICSRNGSGVPIVSISNLLPVILYNRLAVMETVLTYRHID